MFQRWQERRCEGGKRDVLKVATTTFQMWEERCSEGGKSGRIRYQLRWGVSSRPRIGYGSQTELDARDQSS